VTLFATLVGVLNAAGVVWVFALMLLISADITARTAFDDPIAGVTEMVSLSLVACVFLQLAHALLQGRFMRVEMFLAPSCSARRRPRARARLTGAVGGPCRARARYWPDLASAWASAEFGRHRSSRSRSGPSSC
jgi:hypothetical protein